jgi:hypothetical protein
MTVRIITDSNGRKHITSEPLLHQPAPVQSCYCPNCEAMGKELAALKAQPAVPDAFGTREGEHPQYIQGWNDCRAEMLKGMK